jgi:hypothetical protein
MLTWAKFRATHFPGSFLPTISVAPAVELTERNIMTEITNEPTDGAFPSVAKNLCQLITIS